MRVEKSENPVFVTSLVRSVQGNSNYVPIWLMRQAGRYLEEYRKVRNSTKSFLEFCYTPEKAAEVTLQPIERFGFDAAIIFSDILVIPDALGVKVEFLQGEGPVLSKTGKDNFQELEFNGDKLLPVYGAIAKVRQKLDVEKSLIGFAGAPWTLATYMIEGGSSKDFENTKSWAYSNPQSFSKFIYILADAVSAHLIRQVKSGCDVIQIFDSWAGTVATGDEFKKWVIEPTAYIVDKIKSEYPDVPVIGFPRGAGLGYIDYANQTGIDAMSVDYNMDMAYLAGKIDIALQGNLDPQLLKYNKESAIIQAKKILDVMRGRKFIFNLGHGILPETPVENVAALVEFVRN